MPPPDIRGPPARQNARRPATAKQEDTTGQASPEAPGEQRTPAWRYLINGVFTPFISGLKSEDNLNTIRQAFRKTILNLVSQDIVEG